MRATAAALLFALTGAELDSCKCIEWSGLNDYLEYRDDGLEYLAIRPQGSGGPVYDYDPNYGVGGCKIHDAGKPPFCTQRFPPAWCAKEWCYIDPTKCDQIYVRSKFFMNEMLFFSYGTCGKANTFHKWYVEGGAETKESLGPLITLVENYVKSNKVAAETAPITSHHAENCGASSSACPCNECSPVSRYWPGKRVNFEDITMLAGDKSPAGNPDDGTCLGRGVSTTYLNMASNEYDLEYVAPDTHPRIGYQYFGHQASGAYGQWPLTDLSTTPDMCNGDYDPRFRPWYASIATGAKDVVLVLDKSGSMGTAGRIALARKAALAAIDTLSDYDWVGIVLFNDRVMAYGDYLIPATVANKAALVNYINSNLVDAGGTNFRDSLTKAFDILKASLGAGSSSMCMRAVMFLTDGVAEFNNNDYAQAKSRVDELSVAMFTYALGSGAETTVTQTLACQNRGIFYKVSDGGDLKTIMSSYFQYFAYGTRTCNVRWIEYQDTITKATLLAGCLPFYEKTTTQKTAPLRGVSCVDLNVVAPLDKVKQQSSYGSFVCQTSQISMTCEALYLRDVDLADIRASAPAAQMCPGDTPGVYTADDGYCVDPACRDTPNYMDAQGYTCDQWVGDKCDVASGYTAAQKAELLANCPYSCLKCARLSAPEGCQDTETTSTCDDVTGNLPCNTERRRPSPAPAPGSGGGGVSAGTTADGISGALMTNSIFMLLAIGWAF